MKHLKYRKPCLIFLLFSITAISNMALAQTKYKYGKIDKAELEMTVYPNDSSANAVMLYSSGYTYYSYVKDFKITTEVKKRIKILTDDGVGIATIQIPYYKRGNLTDNVYGIEAFSYNLENGKIEKSKLEKSQIFNEKISDYLHLTKLAIPNVKKGSVIEYKYEISSPYYYFIPDWTFQEDFPVIESVYEVKIPEFFVFNVESRGYERINVVERSENQTFVLNEKNQIYRVPCNTKVLKMTINDVPALKNENFVWNLNDFRSLVHFEISGTKFPQSAFKPFTSTWEDIEKTLKDNTDFVKNINKGAPYKDELKQFESIADEDEKIEAIYAFVKNKIRWNGMYAFTDNPNDAVKNGTGNNAQINGVLISIYNQMGFNAYPVLIRRRSQGRLPLSHPSLDKITTFVVAVEKTDGSIHFIDGSAVYGGLNMLPSDLMVDRGRTFNTKRANSMVDLSKIGNNAIVVLNKTTISPEGKMTVSNDTHYRWQLAYHFKNKYNNEKDSATYIEKIENDNNFEITEYQAKDVKNHTATTVVEHIEFTKQAVKRGDFIYINPLILPHLTKNNFTQSDRKLPIEFEFPYSIQITSIITIPEGFEIEELPKSEKVEMENGTGNVSYLINSSGSDIVLRYSFKLNEVVLPFTSYPIVRDFWGKVVTKNAEMIVLKKK